MFISTLAVAAFVAAAPAVQRVPVSGSVVDALNGEPIVGASIALSGANAASATNELGEFSLELRSDAGATLMVSHPDFLPARVALGNVRAAPPSMLVMLTRRPAASATSEAARGQAAALAEQTGGSLWLKDEFEIFESRSGHPLDLLFFSGLAGHVSDTADCVVLRGSTECARVQVGDGSNPSLRVTGWAPADVEAFVVVAPGAPSLSGEAAGVGLVAVFLRSESP